VNQHISPYRAFLNHAMAGHNMAPPTVPFDHQESVSNQDSTAIARLLPVVDDVILAGGRIAKGLVKMKFAKVDEASGLPEVVAHPYRHALPKELIGGAAATLVGATPFGMWAGRAMAARDHSRAIRGMGDKANDLPTSVRHPYAVQTALDFAVTPLLSGLAASVIHRGEKQDYVADQQRLEKSKAAYQLYA